MFSLTMLYLSELNEVLLEVLKAVFSWGGKAVLRGIFPTYLFYKLLEAGTICYTSRILRPLPPTESCV